MAAKLTKSEELVKKSSSNENALSKEHILKLYEEMLFMRRFEEKAGQLYGMGMIAGFCHLYIGQEAIAVGMKATMNEGDSVITTYRDHGHMISCGSDPRRIMAELLGRKDGYAKGKGGSMHLFDLKNKFYGGHGIVGASVPIGAGIAFADKYLENNNVTYCYFGDGAANQGQVYEAFNMAKLWNLPVMFIIENNQYAMGTSVARSASTTEFYKRGESFGIPGMLIDGMDVFSVINDAKKAADYIRSGNGPIVVEAKTYRYRGHSMSDPATYRTKQEVEQMKGQDPIEKLLNYINSNSVASEDEIKKIESSVKKLVTECADFAIASPEPDESELLTEILQ